MTTQPDRISIFHMYAFCDSTSSLTMDNCVFVSAKNWKEARNMIMREPEHKHKKLTHIIGKRIRNNCCGKAAFIPLEDVIRSMCWFVCKCGSSAFVALDDGGTCRCTSCGKEQRVRHPLS